MTSGSESLIFSHIELSTLLGGVLRSVGDYSTAEAVLQTALDSSTEKFGNRHHATAISANALGVLYKSLGRFDEARKLYDIALDALDGKASNTAANLFHNIAGLEHVAGSSIRAVIAARKGLEIRRSTYGESHPLVAADLSNLGGILFADATEEAGGCFAQARDIFARTYGPRHPEVAVSINNLAALAHRKGCFSEAEALYREGISIQEEKLGCSHLDVQVSYYNLAKLLIVMKRSSEALPLLTKTIENLSKMVSDDHHILRLSRRLLGQVRI
ncbi:tetratricopeptide repeat protein [Streptomyces cinereoruber]|uniref:tetratricopeptide repeat protein n=1 Tax=Streptomyces cinereoruber TaxID=67260 RepID=UPI00362FB83A